MEDKHWPYFITIIVAICVAAFFLLIFASGEKHSKRFHEKELACISQGKTYIRGNDGYICVKIGT